MVLREEKLVDVECKSYSWATLNQNFDHLLESLSTLKALKDMLVALEARVVTV